MSIHANKVSPFLWFDGRSEEAAKFYVSVFPNSRLLKVERITAGPAEDNAVVEFEIEGLKFGAVDGGPMFKITPAISFVVACDSQEEIDYYWERLSRGWCEEPVRMAGGQVRGVVAGGARCVE